MLAVIALALVVYAQDKVPSDIGALDKERVEKAFKRPFSPYVVRGSDRSSVLM
jgi:hypothetical protein